MPLSLPTRSLPANNLLIGLAYVALGWLSTGLAVAGGYASPVFPAAGLALAVVLHLGAAVLPGVWLGSVALHLLLALNNAALTAADLVAAMTIASGATAQAWLGRILIRRWQGEAWRTLDNAPAVFRFLLLGGPVACLVSASVGILSLFLAGVLPRAALPFAWWSWFAGDTFGVLTFAPLTLCFLLPDDPLWQARRRRMVVPISITLALAAGAFHTATRWERNELELRLQSDGTRIHQRIGDRLLSHREALLSLRSFIEVTPELTDARFNAFTRATLQNSPDIFALSYNAYVPSGERAGFEAAMGRQLGRPEFRITERNLDGSLQAASRRDAFVPVTYIAPLPANQRAVGFDIASEAIRWDAVNRALVQRTGIAVTAPVLLVQENQAAVLALAPVRLAGKPAPQGFAVAVIRVGQLVDRMLRDTLPPGLSVALVDPYAIGSVRRLDNGGAAPSAAHPERSWERKLHFGDREWLLQVTADERYLESQRSLNAWAVGVAGLLFTTLLQALLLGLTGRNWIVQRQVDRHTADLAAKNRELALATVSIHKSPDAAFWVLPDARIARVNPAACRLLGYSADELLALRVPDIDPDITEACWHALWAKVWATGAEVFESTHRGRDGRQIGVAVSASLVSTEGQDYLYACVRDITERRAADAELTRHRLHLEELVAARSADLSVAKEAAEAANRAKSSFLANMSHELRTPMHAIIGLTHLLRRNNNDPAQQDRLDKIANAANHLLRQLEDVLELARVDAERIPIEQNRFAIGEVVGRVLELVGPSLEGKGLGLQLDIDPDLATRPLIGDPLRLQQVLGHIVGNAVKFTGSGMIVVRARLADVQASGALLAIEVQDSGIGIPPADRERIFSPFEQADGSTTRRFGGSGLGLAICRRLARLMGGDIDVTGEAGHGSTFRITLRIGVLPEATPPAPHAASTAAEAERRLRCEHRHRRLLLVEDDWVNQEVTLELLREELGLQVDLAPDGAEAVRLCNKTAYDLILMDIQMPVMDGLTATRAIRAGNGPSAHAPIVAMTANTFDEDRRACADAGMDDFIPKPANPDRLFITLLRWLERPPLAPCRGRRPALSGR
ncbi:CHASE domain-containing protein [Zoogloea sp.]|uniref:CHASE domain-containing protein n=1 Tax=Zoogloea sp. TaxID=49181 RepID=UPI0035B4B78D